MTKYVAPLRDTRFVLDEIIEYSTHFSIVDPSGEVDMDLLNAIAEEAAKFAENEIAPLYRTGDTQGCKLQDGKVTTPDGFGDAYAKFVENGWPSISGDPEYGGQGLLPSVGTMVMEFMATAN